jgi:hypothetical protein
MSCGSDFVLILVLVEISHLVFVFHLSTSFPSFLLVMFHHINKHQIVEIGIHADILGISLFKYPAAQYSKLQDGLACRVLLSQLT